MPRPATPPHDDSNAPRSDSVSVLIAAMLLACLAPMLIAISSASGEEQPAAAVSTPASVPRGWIEPLPQAPTAPAAPSAASNRPATLRLPDDARPIRGTRVPDPPAPANFDARLLSAFTSGIQPLLLNRCATGKCHGGADAAEPQFQRQLFRGNIDREMTLANITSLTSALGPGYDARTLLVAASTPHGGGTQPPLAGVQLQRLAGWIEAALAQQATWRRVELASFESPASKPSPQQGPAAAPLENNRFQQLLDEASNPQPLPPPQEPTGIIPLEELPEAQPQGK
jgi:hypothetical protein